MPISDVQNGPTKMFDTHHYIQFVIQFVVVVEIEKRPWIYQREKGESSGEQEKAI